jgi:hypothetical protein
MAEFEQRQRQFKTAQVVNSCDSRPNCEEFGNTERGLGVSTFAGMLKSLLR